MCLMIRPDTWTRYKLLKQRRLIVAGYNHTLGISDPAYALVNGALHAGVGRLAMMPLVTLAARLCPKVKPLLMITHSCTIRSYTSLLSNVLIAALEVCRGYM